MHEYLVELLQLLESYVPPMPGKHHEIYLAMKNSSFNLVLRLYTGPAGYTPKLVSLRPASFDLSARQLAAELAAKYQIKR